jgi:hypothetical protein
MGKAFRRKAFSIFIQCYREGIGPKLFPNPSPLLVEDVFFLSLVKNPLLRDYNQFQVCIMADPLLVSPAPIPNKIIGRSAHKDEG